jgi:Sulfotransferase family
MAMSAERLTPKEEQKRVPDFFIVGHPKSGTTALYEMLRRHPEIYMPDLKEPWFFASERHSRPHSATSSVLPDSLEDYLSLFDRAKPGQRLGEASARYLWSHTAASGIAEVQPAARIIAILREPVSFLRSLHLQLVQQHQEPENDLRRAISLEEARRQGRYVSHSASYWPQVLLYSEYMRYVEQLSRYHALFPPEQVLVLIYDDFRRDNEAAVRAVQRFLDVDDTHPIEMTEANPTVRVRSLRLNNLVRAAYMGEGPVSGAVKASVKAFTPRQLRRDTLETIQRRVVYGDARPPDEGLIVDLRRRYKPEVVALSKYLDRDLVSLWDYGDVD